MSDEISRALQGLTSTLPKPRVDLSEEEKDQLIARVGPRAARDIVRAKKDFSLTRIPFLFSSIDTQAVVDILANDCDAAIARALKR